MLSILKVAPEDALRGAEVFVVGEADGEDLAMPVGGDLAVGAVQAGEEGGEAAGRRQVRQVAQLRVAGGQARHPRQTTTTPSSLSYN